VNATESMPPVRVYTSTMASPSIMPCQGAIAPPVSTLKTSPIAVTCADVHPRYDMTMQRLVTTSTGRL